MLYEKGPFASWVPKPVMLLLILVYMLVISCASSIYLGNYLDIVGAQAAYTEVAMMANNAMTVGMGVSMLLGFRIKLRFKSRQILSVSLIILAALSYICATTDSSAVLILCSLLIGFFKMAANLEMFLPLMFVISPSGDRGKSYAVIYPYLIGISQAVIYWFAVIAENGSWQSPYFLMSFLLLVLAALSRIVQHDKRFAFKLPLYQIDWLSVLMFTASFMSINFGLCFMRQQNWFNSPYILISLIGGILLFVAVILRQGRQKRKLIDFSTFKQWNVIHASVLFIFFGIYLSTSSIYSQYALNVLRYPNVVNAEVQSWTVPGVLFSGVLALIGFNKKWPLKYFILLGFFFMFLHTFMLYLLISPEMDIRYLKAAMMVKGVGMGILFIGPWYLASIRLTLDQIMGVFAVLIVIRTCISTAFGQAVISYALYSAQLQSLSDMASVLDAGTVPGAGAAYRTYAQSALMNSAKIVLGAACWLFVPVAVFILTNSYGSMTNRRLVILRRAFRNRSFRGYKIKQEQQA